MWQVFKRITPQQYTKQDLETHKRFDVELETERSRIDRMIEANRMMIEQLEAELENMK